MIAREFLVELERISDSFEWKLVPDMWLGLERRSRPRFRIRGSCKYGPAHIVFEPIGAVCYIRTGRVCADDAWLEAATAIELSLIDAGDLMAAADDRGWVETTDSRKPSKYLQNLRKRLAATLSLKLTP
jgi:hypothetical protein